ncbi:serine/threonine-protein phosphatase [Nocardia stercoris]|uniref:Serine/threonine-protein phosphatase n=1 Tax=Nocardia stercoris TaxID=2483361 RepID=A0A3M2KXE7_9NOCA|nr:serine/threonine-protein phosphatase [Nocardia stercoris]
MTDRFCEACGHELAIRRALLPDFGIPAGSVCESCAATEFDADGYCVACGEWRRPADRSAADLGAVQLVTDRGIAHARNEDSVAAAVLDDPTGSVVVIAVCDGVSTSENPQAASAAAARTGVDECVAALAADRPSPEAAVAGLEAAAIAVRDVATSGHAPSCTYVAAVVRPTANDTHEVTVINVGDSRAYWLSAGTRDDVPAQRLTVDDSWAQALVDSGVMDEEAAMRDPRAHALYRWLGADSDRRPGDTRPVTVEVRGPGALLLCSDGLWNYLSDPVRLAELALARPAETAAHDLVDFAVQSGGSDNITVALVPIVPSRASVQQ